MNRAHPPSLSSRTSGSGAGARGEGAARRSHHVGPAARRPAQKDDADDVARGRGAGDDAQRQDENQPASSKRQRIDGRFPRASTGACVRRHHRGSGCRVRFGSCAHSRRDARRVGVQPDGRLARGRARPDAVDACARRGNGRRRSVRSTPEHHGCAKYLRWLLDHNRGNIPLSLAGYNAGPTIVAKYRKVPPFRETQNYVKKITGFIADARREAVLANE